MVFVALDGRDAGRVGERIVSTAAALNAVQRGSIRYAVSPARFRLCLPKTRVPRTPLPCFERRPRGCRGMTIVRLMRNGMFVEPAAVHARAELKVM